MCAILKAVIYSTMRNELKSADEVSYKRLKPPAVDRKTETDSLSGTKTIDTIAVDSLGDGDYPIVQHLSKHVCRPACVACARECE